MQLRGLEPEWIEFGGARFQLKPLTAAQRAECLAQGFDPTAYARMVDKALRFALVDWQDVTDPDGNSVEFAEDLIDRIPEEAWSFLGKMALGLSNFEAEDAKN